MILFDLDGTLTDSGPGITRCVQYALASFGIEEPDLEKLNCYVGPPLLESFMNFAGLGCEEAQQAITKYRERYEAEGIFENEVYGGIPEVLAYLKEKGKILAVASSKPEKYVEQILEHFEIRKYFTVVTGSEMNETRTDKGEVIAETLRRLGAEDSRSDVVMVGDRSYDVIGARENRRLSHGRNHLCNCKTGLHISAYGIQENQKTINTFVLLGTGKSRENVFIARRFRALAE